MFISNDIISSSDKSVTKKKKLIALFENSNYKCKSWLSLAARLETINTNRREVVEASWLLVVRWVIQTPFGSWNLLRERLWIAPLATEALVFRHWPLDISHHYLIVVGYKVIMDSACWLRGALIVPIDCLVVSSSNLVCFSNEPIWMTRGRPPSMPVWMLSTPFSPSSPCNIWVAAMISLYFMKFWLPFFW